MNTTKICPICETQFEPEHEKQDYCSKECTISANTSGYWGAVERSSKTKFAQGCTVGLVLVFIMFVVFITVVMLLG